MSPPYTVVKTGSGCASCSRGAVFEVVGPDETALSQSWEETGEEGAAEEDANQVAGWLNTAFELGRQSVGDAVSWRPFETDAPLIEGHVLVWDMETKLVSSFWYDPAKDLEQVRQWKYTHWKPTPAGPDIPVLEAAPPIEEPPPSAPTPQLHVQCTKLVNCIYTDGHAGDCDEDDIPF